MHRILPSSAVFDCLYIYLNRYINRDHGESPPPPWHVRNYLLLFCKNSGPILIVFCLFHVFYVSYLCSLHLFQFFMHMNVFPACISIKRVHPQGPQQPEEDIRSLGTGVTDACQLPCGCWEFNTHTLQEQLVITEPTLKHLSLHSQRNCVIVRITWLGHSAQI